jgi:RNase P/RNase MRP subunit POP5
MEDVKPMNKGVLILLERMSSNPDEFVPDVTGLYPPKWRSTILSVTMRMKGGKDYEDQLSFLSDEEIKALWHKMQELQGELFTKKVMNTLLQESFTEELSSSLIQANNATSSITLSSLQNIGAIGAGMGGGSVTLNTGAVSGTITGKLRYP